MGTPEIGALLSLETVAVDRAMLEILDHGIGRVESGRIGFKNELHRAYVYYAMGEERRNYFHARVAEWLSQGAVSGDFQRTLEASHHYICAQMPTEACEAALRGAEVALRRGAPGEAERALVSLLRAYPQGPESRVHLVLASALVAEGQFRDAIDALKGWCPKSPAPSDSALAAQLRAEALHRGRLVDDQEILKATTLALSAANMAKADLILIGALQVRAEAASEAGELKDAGEAGEEAQRVAELSGNQEARALAGITAGFCQLISGKFEAAAATFLVAVPPLREMGLQVELRRAVNGLGMSYTGLGRLRDAVASFAQALAVARELGDTVAILSTWNNLGVAYHEGGHFDRAATCYHLAVAQSALPLSSRYAALLYANASRLAMEFGNHTESHRCSTLSLAAARDTQSWRLIAAALLTKADLHLAKSEPEEAWPLVQEALSLVGDRWRLLADAGQFARLRAHVYWATNGHEPPETAAEGGLLCRVELGVRERLELRAFDEWVTSLRNGATPSDVAAHELVKRGLFGSLARLLAIGVRFRDVPAPGIGESSAQLVARVFEPEQRVALPPVDDLLQQGAVPSNSA
jgi:tetratricopeptide (TPR) repeat protein